MPAKRHKKGPTKGSGGKHRRALEGKSSTLPAEQRHWYEDKQRAKAAKRPKSSPRAEQRSRTEKRQRKVDSDLLVGRNPVVEALRAVMPATRLFLVNSLDPDSRVTEAARLAGDQGVDVVEVNRTKQVSYQASRKRRKSRMSIDPSAEIRGSPAAKTRSVDPPVASRSARRLPSFD